MEEAIIALGDAISIERDQRRSTIHPFMTLFNGVTAGVEMGAVLSAEQRQILRTHIEKAIDGFPRDSELREKAGKLRSLL